MHNFIENPSKNLADDMVKYNPKQISIKEFKTGLGRSLNPENRWVRLAEILPWDQLHEIYADTLCRDFGRPAKYSRLILGSIIVKHKKHLTDEELIEEIKENPYIQYFLGYEGFTYEKPFDPTLLVTIRKRLGQDVFNDFNQELIARIQEVELANPPEPKKKKRRKKKQEPPPSNQSELSLEEKKTEGPSNKGQLLVDAFVAPQDIKFPTDLDLLNKAREEAERLIDLLYIPEPGKTKPRTYRNKARKDFLIIAKKKKKTKKELRQAIRKQLNYLSRDIGHILKLLDPKLGKPLPFSFKDQRKFWIIQEIFRQQLEMYKEKKHTISDRIVSFFQPHVRPIVRGKSSHPVEFGAKISAALVDGYAYVDHISWDAFNENKDLKAQVELYRERFGFYPESAIVDNIYGTRENRRYMKERGIRLSCKPLGRPKKMTEAEHRAFWKQLRKDTKKRNGIEGKFGEGKRKYGLDRIMAKTAPTSESWISAIFFVMNLSRWERVLFVLIRECLESLIEYVKEQRVLAFSS